MSELFLFLRSSIHVPQKLKQLVYIANILSVSLSILTFVLFLILFKLFGWTPTSPYILLVATFFLLFVLVNKRFYDLGRLLFCLTPVWITMFVSLYGKYVEINQSYIVYFDSRYILLATTILPGIVFTLDERIKISICLISTLLCLIFFDPIHNALGLGYYQRGFTALSYYYINYVTVTAYFVLLFGVITLKTITERAQQVVDRSLQEKGSINNQLVERNLELSGLNFDNEARNEEMQQQEELAAGRDKLEYANQLIQEQTDKLSIYNNQLEELVKEKSKSLYLTNEELVKHNNELQQFSYTVSHNLRGPVARLLGLAQLFNKDSTEDVRAQIVNYIQQSAIDLDSVLKDLNTIIDIRNELYNIREKILIAEEWNKAVAVLKENIRPEFVIHTDFSRAPHAYGIRAMLQSILYNLLSNAIKYQSPDRPLNIQVTTQVGPKEEIIFSIRDNGLGIDLSRQQENVFKLYKRFHSHVMGKGLGLFIVKTQLEIMGGTIVVESQLNKGTLFRFTLPKPVEAERQIFFENEAAQLYFDADINTTVIVWKKKISSNEYRNVFETMLQTLKTYSTPGWIADLREQGTVEEQDQIWFVSTVIPEAVQNGLKRLITIGFKDPIRKDYFNRMMEIANKYNLDLFVFETLEHAREKVKEYLYLKSDKL